MVSRSVVGEKFSDPNSTPVSGWNAGEFITPSKPGVFTVPTPVKGFIVDRPSWGEAKIVQSALIAKPFPAALKSISVPIGVPSPVV